MWETWDFYTPRETPYHNPVVINTLGPRDNGTWTREELIDLGKSQNGHGNEWLPSSTSYNVPAITLDTSIDTFKYIGYNMWVETAGDGFYALHNDTHIEIANMGFYGLNPNVDQRQKGRAINIEDAHTVIVTHCSAQRIGGFKAKNIGRQGAGPANPTVQFWFCDFLMMDRKVSSGVGTYYDSWNDVTGGFDTTKNCHSIGIRQGKNLTSSGIFYCRTRNRYYNGSIWEYSGSTEDVFNLDCGGASDADRFTVRGNITEGLYTIGIDYDHTYRQSLTDLTTPTQAEYDEDHFQIGCGIVIDSPNLNYNNGSRCLWMDIVENTLINCTNNDIGIAKWAIINAPNPGANPDTIRIRDNIIVSSGTLADYSGYVYKAAGVNFLQTSANVALPGSNYMPSITGNEVAACGTKYQGGSFSEWQIQQSGSHAYETDWTTYFDGNNTHTIPQADTDLSPLSSVNLDGASNADLGNPGITTTHELRAKYAHYATQLAIDAEYVAYGLSLPDSSLSPSALSLAVSVETPALSQVHDLSGVGLSMDSSIDRPAITENVGTGTPIPVAPSIPGPLGISAIMPAAVAGSISLSGTVTAGVRLPSSSYRADIPGDITKKIQT